MRRTKVVALAPVMLFALSANAMGAPAGRSVGGEAQAAVVRADTLLIGSGAASSKNASEPDAPEERAREPDPDAGDGRQGGAGPPDSGPDGLEIMIIADTDPFLVAEEEKADGGFHTDDCGGKEKRYAPAVDDGERVAGYAARDTGIVDGGTGRRPCMADGEAPLAVRWQHSEDGDIWHGIPGANNLSYSLTATDETVNYAWRLAVVVV